MADKKLETLETERLRLREATLDDAAFALSIYNDAAFLEFIGDKKLRTLEDARNYIAENFIGSYRSYGVGMLIVELKDSGEPIGVCGLVKRPYFEEPDIGFAFLSDYTSQGYGYEAALASLKHAITVQGHKCVQALVSPHNVRSIGLIEKLGFRFDRDEILPGNENPTKIFTITA
ncbi:GNAT family N-acetyltransferase [Kordiimonas sp.]|uniref:GNAT family N-acetyltransferase n=1 Tax=Kordiimonas sp. TaxID=1970157 RepID=UPI003A95D5BD